MSSGVLLFSHFLRFVADASSLQLLLDELSLNQDQLSSFLHALSYDCLYSYSQKQLADFVCHVFNSQETLSHVTCPFFCFYVQQLGYELGQNNSPTILAYVMGRSFLDQVEIDYLYVNKNFRKCGVASFLLTHLKKRQAEKDLSLEVAVGNRAAIAFYEKNGFQKKSVRKKYYQNGEDAFLMISPPLMPKGHGVGQE